MENYILRRQLGKLRKSYGRYQSNITEMENALAPYIEFDFSVDYQASDNSHVIVDLDTTQNASLSHCIIIIELHGKLTKEDYNNVTI